MRWLLAMCLMLAPAIVDAGGGHSKTKRSKIFFNFGQTLPCTELSVFESRPTSVLKVTVETGSYFIFVRLGTTPENITNLIDRLNLEAKNSDVIIFPYPHQAHNKISRLNEPLYKLYRIQIKNNGDLAIEHAMAGD
ncbi:MAG TPA: hypothetical protein VEL47_04170 [Myxococcota bacterium]|nr:hypothetical protein [Myxococcota bacterium]